MFPLPCFWGLSFWLVFPSLLGAFSITSVISSEWLVFPFLLGASSIRNVISSEWPVWLFSARFIIFARKKSLRRRTLNAGKMKAYFILSVHWFVVTSYTRCVILHLSPCFPWAGRKRMAILAWVKLNWARGLWTLPQAPCARHFTEYH